MDIQTADDIVVSFKENFEVETIPEGVNDLDKTIITVHKTGDKIEGVVNMINPETGRIAIDIGNQDTLILFLRDLDVHEINGEKV